MIYCDKGLWLAVACIGMSMPAMAQDTPPSAPKTVVPIEASGEQVTQIQGRRDALFAVMLQRPDDLDAAFEYAALSVQVGDLEAAVSTLERMLIFAPGLPRLQLELGVLYYRLSAFETARSYFQAALSGPDVPPEVQAKVKQYLSGIDSAGETERYAGQIRAGIRYQSNANRSPTGSVILLNGIPFILDVDSQGVGDGNVYLAGVFHASYELPSQGDSLEVDLVTYGSKQFERDEIDVALAELTVGPAFDLGRFGIDNAAVGIYGIASGVFVGDDFYSAGGGVGTRFVSRPTPATSVIASLEYRHKEYYDSDSSPTASFRNGDELRAVLNGSYILSPNLLLSASAYMQRAWADKGYLSYLEGGFSAGPRMSFASPVSSDMGAWTVALTGGVLFRGFDDPDPAINATEEEDDWEAFVAGGLTIPLNPTLAAITEVEYRYADSNYDTRKYDNFSVSFSLAKSF